MKTAYQKAWEKLYAQLSFEDQDTVILSPDGAKSIELAMKAQKLAEKTERAYWRRRQREQAMRDLGLVKVRGALGGTYWE